MAIALPTRQRWGERDIEEGGAQMLRIPPYYWSQLCRLRVVIPGPMTSCASHAAAAEIIHVER